MLQHFLAEPLIELEQQSGFPERPLSHSVFGSQLLPVAHLAVVANGQAVLLQVGEDPGCLR